MTDCPNAEIRDRLPDLLHDRLDAASRAEIMAHVDGCEDCREELEVLRGVRRAIVAGTPRVNLSEIVYALPKAPHAAGTPIRRMPKVDWRLAAAVTLLVAGASSMKLLSKENAHGVKPVDSGVVAAAPSPGAVRPGKSAPVTVESPTSVVAAPETVASANETTDAVSSARLAGLSAKQIQALIGDIDQMQAVPVSDPEPVAIRLDAKAGPSAPEGM
ncbi:MAG: zf-HC2 domain-containing protein [Gemmatimonadaceae bacterium]